MTTDIFFTVVIPVFNSETIITKTIDRIISFFKESCLQFEIILVNDGSTDNSWEIISKKAVKVPEITAINLLKNYGQHNANLCGFRTAKGDYIITMDDDLQNPPEEISKLIELAYQGYDLVIGRFEEKQHSSFRRIGSAFVGKLNRIVFDVDESLTLTNFRLLRRDVVDRICRDQSVNPYIPGLALKYSTKRCNVLVKHLPRLEGKSTYTLRKLLGLVANILFNHSTIPLRLSSAIGFMSSLISFFLGIYYLTTTLVSGTSVPGWASLVVLISFFSGILVLLLSIIGEYLIRILREVSSNQSYEILEIVKNE